MNLSKQNYCEYLYSTKFSYQVVVGLHQELPEKVMIQAKPPPQPTKDTEDPLGLLLNECFTM